MITRNLKVEELHCRTRPGGGPSHFATMTVDEVGPITLRITSNEYEQIGAAIAKGARFTFSLRLAPPKLDELVSRDSADGAA